MKTLVVAGLDSSYKIWRASPRPRFWRESRKGERSEQIRENVSQDEKTNTYGGPRQRKASGIPVSSAHQRSSPTLLTTLMLLVPLAFPPTVHLSRHLTVPPYEPRFPFLCGGLSISCAAPLFANAVARLPSAVCDEQQCKCTPSLPVDDHSPESNVAKDCCMWCRLSW